MRSLLLLSRNEAYQKEKEEINKARAAEDAYVAGDFYHEEVRYASFNPPVAWEIGHTKRDTCVVHHGVFHCMGVFEMRFTV